MRLLSPTALLARLEEGLGVLAGGPIDVPDRQRTLRDTIAWSVALLPPREAALFGRLGVFRGGFDLAAAHAVAAPGIVDTEDELLEALSVLVDHSLVRVTDVDGDAALRDARDDPGVRPGAPRGRTDATRPAPGPLPGARGRGRRRPQWTRACRRGSAPRAQTSRTCGRRCPGPRRAGDTRSCSAWRRHSVSTGASTATSARAATGSNVPSSLAPSGDPALARALVGLARITLRPRRASHPSPARPGRPRGSPGIRATNGPPVGRSSASPSSTSRPADWTRRRRSLERVLEIGHRVPDADPGHPTPCC